MLWPTFLSTLLSWCQVPIWGPKPDFLTVRQLRVCWCGLPSLMREQVCRLQLLLWPPERFSGMSPAKIMTIFYCLRFETPQLGGPGPRTYIPQEQGGPVIPSGTGFPFRRLLRFAGLLWKYSNPPIRGEYKYRYSESESESELLYYWRFTANQFVLAPRPLTLTTSEFFNCMGSIENTASNISSIVTCVLVAVGLWHDRIEITGSRVFTMVFPSKGYPCYLHDTVLQQIWRNVRVM
jgi:hypothetical protein